MWFGLGPVSGLPPRSGPLRLKPDHPTFQP
jgi:hypothetical protein